MDPKNAYALHARACAHSARGELQAALRDYEQAIRFCSDEADKADYEQERQALVERLAEQEQGAKGQNP